MVKILERFFEKAKVVEMRKCNGEKTKRCKNKRKIYTGEEKLGGQ